MIHEQTTRNRTAVGETAPTSDPTAEARKEFVGSGARVERVGEFGAPMVSSVPKGRSPRTLAPTHAGPTAPAIRTSEGETRESASERASGRRVQDGSLDLAAGVRGDRKIFRGFVSSLSCLETPDRFGVELPEAGAPRPATERRGDRALEAVPLAPYKKTPKRLAPIWCFSMRAVFFSFPTLPAPGGREEKHLLSDICTSRIGSPPSARWRCPRKGSAWPFTCGVAPGTLTGWTSGIFSNTCCGIFEDLWFSCGIVAPSTGARRSRNSFGNAHVFMWNSSLPMRRNSTRRNSYGARRTRRWPTLRRRTWTNSKGCSEAPFAEYGIPRSSFGPASMRPIFRGHDDLSFICAKINSMTCGQSLLARWRSGERMYPSRAWREGAALLGSLFLDSTVFRKKAAVGCQFMAFTGTLWHNLSHKKR